MNNFIKYFYGIDPVKVTYHNKYYSFNYNGYIYKLYIYEDSYNNLLSLYNQNQQLIKNTLMSEIILNNHQEIISNYNNINYILIKTYINEYKKITLDEITYLSNHELKKDKLNINWGNLWSKKIDYLEDLINENGKKYPLIVDSFNYFVGMAENAIGYFNSIALDPSYKYVISHKIIHYYDTIDAIYNPLNITFDYKSRDLAEYIKNSFFNKNYNIGNELIIYLKRNPLSLFEVKLLIARLMYPSFYFDMYEDILIDNKEEKILLEIITKLDEYEDYLYNVIKFFKNNYDIEEIDWLKKKEE